MLIAVGGCRGCSGSIHSFVRSVVSHYYFDMPSFSEPPREDMKLMTQCLLPSLTSVQEGPARNFRAAVLLAVHPKLRPVCLHRTTFPPSQSNGYAIREHSKDDDPNLG